MKKIFTQLSLKGFMMLIIAICFSANASAAGVATLPFAYDGGKSGLPAGCTETGLGSDYKEKPNLKFDTTNDKLELTFEGSAEALTFDLKGNGTAATFDGVFSIEESADGVNFTTLEIFNKENPKLLRDKMASFSYKPLATSRYIRWTYTTKASGNVGLGNIKLTPLSGENVTLNIPTFEYFDLQTGSLPTEPFFGMTAIMINSNNEKGNVYYTTDGSDPTSSSTLFNFSENGPVIIEQTTVLKAIVIDGDQVSPIASDTYTALPAENMIASVADLKAKGTDDKDFILFAPNTLYYLFGDGRNHYISDGGDMMLIYGENIFPAEITEGAALQGAMIGNYINYNGILEIKNVQILQPYAVNEYDDPMVVTPKETTFAAISADVNANLHTLVTLKNIRATANATFVENKSSNATFAEGENTFLIRSAFQTLAMDIEKDKTYNVTGFVSVYNNVAQIYPRSNADIVEVTGTSLDNIETATLSIATTKGAVTISVSEATTIHIHAVSGQLIHTAHVSAGVTTIALPAGVYVIAGKKVVIL